jgi:hypothetical protein
MLAEGKRHRSVLEAGRGVPKETSVGSSLLAPARSFRLPRAIRGKILFVGAVWETRMVMWRPNITPPCTGETLRIGVPDLHDPGNRLPMIASSAD